MSEPLYTPLPDWMQSPADVPLNEAIGVAVDSRDRLFIFNRGEPAIIIMTPDGRLEGTWHNETIVRPHGIWIASDDTLILVDDMGHSVRRFSAEGTLLEQIGPMATPSESGAEGFDYRTIAQAAGPYNLPTNAVTTSNGDLVVTDGYGNAAVHYFDAEGTLIRSWGAPGTGPGEFCVPHGLGIDENDRLFVADRENSRIQIFSTDGALLATWTDVVRPCQVFIKNERVFVAELGRQLGLFPWMEREEDAIGSRVSIFDLEGRLLQRWGGGNDPYQANQFGAAHDIWVDSRGDIYVGEVAKTATQFMNLDSPDLPTLRKFACKRA